MFVREGKDFAYMHDGIREFLLHFGVNKDYTLQCVLLSPQNFAIRIFTLDGSEISYPLRYTSMFYVFEYGFICIILFFLS